VSSKIIAMRANRKPYLSPFLKHRDLLAKNRKFFPTPFYLFLSFSVTHFEFMEKLNWSWN